MTTIISGDSGITFPNSTVQASAGQVLQVVNATYATQASTSSNTYTDTGLTATITPRFSTSKILVLISHTECQKDGGGTANRIKMILLRNGSQLIQIASDNLYTGVVSTMTAGIPFSYFDSPATTSATAYKTQFASNGGTGAVYMQNGNMPSTITLMEIAQ